MSTEGQIGTARLVQELGKRAKTALEEQLRGAPVGYIVIVFESPQSLRTPQVSLQSDHDQETVERLCQGVADKIRLRSPLIA